ncbi:MAG: glycosyltransferase [Bacteroidetes bacterium]|jgi:glycosyltransferase involved in cell wall biosynthesis|nr:glycosyltransferase [Bacteroidota bacterium]
MKVLQIIDSLATGGAEKLIIDSLPLYRNAGIEMDILVLKDHNYPFMQQLEAQQSCKIYKLGKGSVYHPKHIFGIAKVLSAYDIAHVHLFPAQYWAVLAKKWSAAKTKLVFTEHSTSNRRVKNKPLAVIDRYFYKQYDRIVAISDEIQDIFTTHTRLPAHKFELIYNGIKLKQYFDAKSYSRDVLGLCINDLVLIQVSAFRPGKDHSTLIRALKELPEDVKLLLVGDGILKKACEDLTEELGLNQRIKFLGNRSDVPKLLKTADIVVLSSHHEGMSLASIEGMASGRPFVASDVPGLTDIVKGAGILFPQDDVKALAESIERLMKDQSYNNEIRRKCQERASQYDIQLMVNQYVNLYEQTIA